MKAYKYMTRQHFEALHAMEKARGYKFNQSVEFMSALDPAVMFPVLQHVLHNDVEVRVFIATESGKTLMADMPVDFFMGLPTVEVPDDE